MRINWIKTAASAIASGSSVWTTIATAAAALAICWAAVLWHSHQVATLRDTAFKAGKAEVQGQWDKANADAKDAQADKNEQATDQFFTEREVVRVVYRDRIKEVKTYVPQPGTHCPADAGFLQRYNAADATPTSDSTHQ